MSSPPGDLGFWTGSISYTPVAGTPSAAVSVPLGAVDGNGIWWLLEKVEGWDTPDVQGGGTIGKAGDHGAYPAAQYYAARAITLTITATATTQALRDVARSTLQQAVPINDLAVFTYNEPIPKQTMVRRSGKVTETYPTLADVTFTVGLIAPDPRKYSTQVNSVTVNALPPATSGLTSPFTSPFSSESQAPAGAIICTNAGTFETRPLITINGPITSPAVSNVTTGQSVSFTGLNVTAGSVLLLDFSLAQATLNGVYRPADLMSSWWTLPPGTSTVQLSGQADSSASMTVVWQSAYM